MGLDAPEMEKTTVNIPNLLSISRILSVPVFIVLMLEPSPIRALIAGIVFSLASATDWLDGYLARTRKAITTFGIVMDPVADKLLILGMLFVFADPEIGLLPLWLALVNLFRELLISGIRAVQAAEGKIIPANWMGKLKFCLQVAVIGMGFLQLLLESADIAFPAGRHIVFYSTIAMTCASLAFGANFLRWHGRGMMKKHT